MIVERKHFDRLISEAVAQERAGWDFSFLSGRWCEGKTPWNYRRLVRRYAASAGTLLDLGTGSGAFLASLKPLPDYTCATEGHPVLAAEARMRLASLGVQVFQTSSDEPLPFEDERFDLVINRHASFSSGEAYRMLKRGGRFITQQVGDRSDTRLDEFLQGGLDAAAAHWTLAQVSDGLEAAGFRIVGWQEAFPVCRFYDVGAVVAYLKAIPWQISGFAVDKYYDQLRALHDLIEATGGLTVRSHRFYVEGLKA